MPRYYAENRHSQVYRDDKKILIYEEIISSPYYDSYAENVCTCKRETIFNEIEKEKNNQIHKLLNAHILLHSNEITLNVEYFIWMFTEIVSDTENLAWRSVRRELQISTEQRD